MNIPKEYFNLDSIDKEKICQKYKIPIKPKKILISGNGFYKNHITSIKILENLLDKNFDVCIVWIGHKGDVNKINNHNIVNKIYKIPIVDNISLFFTPYLLTQTAHTEPTRISHIRVGAR